MNDLQQRLAAKQFAEYWKGKGYEKGESQPFWISLLRDVFGIVNVDDFIKFEDKVMLDKTSFIDGKISSTHVLIEQKSLGKDLRKPIRQSDGTLLTPFQQAKRYSAELPYSERPRWIVTCNFTSFLVYDMENPTGQPEEILLENLHKEFYRLSFLVENGSEHLKRELEISVKAGELVGLLYDAFYKRYVDPTSEDSLKNLNMLCVRLVFCFYAEDSGIFGKKNMFHDYLSGFDVRNLRKALIELFEVLNTKEEDRDPYMDSELAEFPFVNGGLFSDEIIEIPQLNEEIRDLLLSNTRDDFDWSEISPTIFGAVFESTLNPETRRSGGMHYTSINNIHKVINPLFLNELREELSSIRAVSVLKTRVKRLKEFQDKISGLRFLDPACGSGNFLTETYISLRRLENEMLDVLYNKQISFSDREILNPIKVSISQFYGIEINDFAVTVARTALWIAESQMMKETENIVHMNLDFLPLKSYANITEGNALRFDWNKVIPNNELNYIMGNPPFLGYSLQNKSQKSEMLSIYCDENGKPYNSAGKIDYVAAWYFKAAQYIAGTDIRVAYVSTNSITQGEQVSTVWKPLYNRFNINIDFAWRTFKWNSESTKQAGVYCVIVGFSSKNNKKKYLFLNDKIMKEVQNINPYLVDAPTIFIDSRSKSICTVPQMTTGNRPADGGHLIIEEEEFEEFVNKEPRAVKYIKRLTGATEFINNKARYCLWLVGADPAEIRRMPEVMKRVEACKQDRLNGAPDRQKLADTPMLFRETKNPNSYIIVPAVSSASRRYVPIGFLDRNTIPTNLAVIIPDATLFHFAILTSNVHMAWMRAVCGRLGVGYRYSKDIVYNNFPWIDPTSEQKLEIMNTGQAILDARALYPNSSLADLYDEISMPPELRVAHQKNDRAVMEAYNLSIKDTTEEQCVAELMKLYISIVAKN